METSLPLFEMHIDTNSHDMALQVPNAPTHLQVLDRS